MGVRGAIVLVTGGGHGIGLATARAFGRAGARVFLLDADAPALSRSLAQLADAGIVAAGARADVRFSLDVNAAFEHCEDELGPVSVLVNNAGFSRSRPFLDLPASTWDEVVDVCLTGSFRVARRAARSMAANGGGTILNACSTSAVASEPGQAPYAAAKAGLMALTRAMAVDLAPFGVQVCSVLPGEVATHPWPSVELSRIYELGIPARRFAAPEEVASVYLGLAAGELGALRGSAFVVDGGMLAWR